jgi:uncharacterized membrane protein YedE/YeeE
MKIAVAFVCGIVFALGLGVSGMTLPSVVLGFLDFFGEWNPALLFVMGPAVGIYLVAWKLRHGRRSLWGSVLPGKAAHHLDARLFMGATIFGIGWGLAGVCPGPAVTNLARPSEFTLGFMAAMLVGIALSYTVPKRKLAANPFETASGFQKKSEDIES